MEHLFDDCFLEKIELSAGPKKARFIDSKFFQQEREFGFAFPAGEKMIIAVEVVDMASLEPALHAVTQEMNPTFIEVHPAFLVNECLEKLELRFR
jgi:hypothetical protein